jgi:hypothetical protein
MFERSNKNDKVYSLNNPITLKVPRRDNLVYRFTERYLTTGITSSTTLTVTGAYYFLVNSLNNLSALTSLFDQYRIAKVEMLFIPQIILTNGNSGRFTTVIDYDDNGSPGSENSLFEYQNALTCSGADGQYRTFVPHAAVALYSGAFTSYGNVPSPWIDAASATVQHFGLKYAWSPTDSTLKFDVMVQFHTEWRNVH